MPCTSTQKEAPKIELTKDNSDAPMGRRRLFLTCFSKPSDMQHHRSLHGLACLAGSRELPSPSQCLMYTPLGRPLLLFLKLGWAVLDTTSCALSIFLSRLPLSFLYLLFTMVITISSFLFFTRTWISEALLRESYA